MKNWSTMARPALLAAGKRGAFNLGSTALKSSLFYAVAVILTILFGLGSRIFSNQLPHFVSLHFGDALWAAMVYFGFRFLQVKRGLVFAAFAALLFSFSIELSQLYQADWINEIRNTLAGSLILGKGFLPVDLIRYTVGILLSFLLDRYLLSKCLPTATTGKKSGA